MLGEDPLQLAKLNRRMDAVLKGHPYVKSAMDIACWDLGRLAGGRLVSCIQNNVDKAGRVHDGHFSVIAERFLVVGSMASPSTPIVSLTSADVVYSLLRHKNPATVSKAKAVAEALDGRLQERLPERELRYLWGRVAYHAARSHQEQALQWYARAGDHALDDEQLAWKARAALRREESRGGHFRTDFPQRDDIHWREHYADVRA